MSVRRTTYVLYGCILPYDTADYETCEPFFPDKREAGEAVVLYDGMSANWIIVGVVIQDMTDEADGFDPPVAFGPVPSFDSMGKVAAVVRDLGAEMVPALTYIAVSHYQ